MVVPTTAARFAAVMLVSLLASSAPRLTAQGVAPSVTRGAAALAQPGDQVRVIVWPQSAFGPPFTGVVDAFGNIVMPPIGVVEVGRIPISQLRDTLITRISKYIREPEVDVQVLRRVTVNGAVIKPDIYFMDVSATLRDVIARAGGINEEVGNKKKVSIIRDGKRISVPGWESDTSATSVLHSGDQVLVGRRTWLEINIIPVASLSLATASFLLSLRKH
jgi:protein involved in polysaccharide export with SLBB domain